MTAVQRKGDALTLTPSSERTPTVELGVGVPVTLRDHPWHECRRVGRVVAGPIQRLNSLGRARVYWAVQWQGRPAPEWVAGARLQATYEDESE